MEQNVVNGVEIKSLNNVQINIEDDEEKQGKTPRWSSSTDLIIGVTEVKQNVDMALIDEKNQNDSTKLTITTQLEPIVTEIAQYDWHKIPLHQLSKRLKVNVNLGLNNEQVDILLKEGGLNVLSPSYQTPLWLRFLILLIADFAPILWIALALCLVAYYMGTPRDPTNIGLAVVLLIVIVLQTLFNFFQEQKSNKIMQSITSILPSDATVIRNHGQKIKINSDNLVPGDIVEIKIGEKVPADIRIIDTNNLKVDNSALTGESEPIRLTLNFTDVNYMKTRNLAYFGSNVIEGYGKGVVIKTGDETVMGQISLMTNRQKNEQTNLQKDVTRFVLIIVIIAILTALVSLISWGVWLVPTYPGYMNFTSIIVNVIGLVVAYVPEGLPVCITVTLTLIATRMHKYHILIKRLPIIETFNCINVIASDKTGTLTCNQMTLVDIRLGYNIFNINDEINFNNNQHLSQILKGVILCNNAYFDEIKQKLEGDATDKAIYEYVNNKCKDIWNIKTLREKNEKIAIMPFNSKNKYMLTIHKQENDNKYIIYLKGAPEVVINRCNSMIINDKEINMNIEEKNKLFEEQKLLSEQGKRVIGICQLILNEQDYPNNYKFLVDVEDNLINFPTHNLCFIGMIALIDPPREHVKEAIEKCHEAKIRVNMVTGDHPITAISIAKSIGLISSINKVDSLTISVDDEDNSKNIIKNEIDHIILNNYIHDNNHNNNNEHKDGDTDVDNNNNNNNNNNIYNQLCNCQNQNNQNNKKNNNQHYKNYKRKIFEGKSLVIEGSQIDYFNSNVWDWIINHDEIVFARTTPDQKLRIVTEFQLRNDMVAVTGDGINDAPALKQANLGIAMQSGSEVAREAGHIILLDNNFFSIVKGIEMGRLVFDNLKKVILYLLPAGSWSEMLPVLANVFFGMPLPLSAFLMIVICVLTDVWPSLSLVYEQPESNIMKRKPMNPRKHHLVNWKLLNYGYLNTGMIESFASFFMFFYFMHVNGISPNKLIFAYNNWSDGYCGKHIDELNDLQYRGQCVYFITLVVVQFGNVMSVRTRTLSFFQHNPFYGVNKNHKIFMAMICSIIITLIITLVPFFNHIFHTRPVNVKYYFIALAFGCLVFILDEIRKFFVRNFPNSCYAKLAW